MNNPFKRIVFVLCVAILVNMTGCMASPNTTAPTSEPTMVPTTTPATLTPEPTATNTTTPTPTATNIPTPEPTATNTPTPTPTDTPTPTATYTPTPTPEIKVIVENVEAPTGTLYKGNSYNIEADIVSNVKITEIKGYIIDIDGVIVQEVSDFPNADSYKLAKSKLDKNLKFGELPITRYYYEISIKTEYSDKEETIITSSFVVMTPQMTGITAGVTSKTRYIGDTLTTDDFTVKAVMSDGSKKDISGWTAEPLTLGGKSNVITIYYDNFTATVTVAASEKVAVVTPEP